MRRREFMTLVGGAVVAILVLTSAQPQTMPVIRFLNSASADGYAVMAAAFRQRLKIAYAEVQNVAIRSADIEYDQLPALAADLVGCRLIVANSPSIARPRR